MHEDVGSIIQTTHNLELFCNLKVIICLFYIMPTLERFNDLINSPSPDNVLFVILLLQSNCAG